jgi:hypothetical protein
LKSSATKIGKIQVKVQLNCTGVNPTNPDNKKKKKKKKKVSLALIKKY